MANLSAFLLHVPELRRPRVNLRALDLHTDKLPLPTLLLDLRKRLIPDEVRLLVEIHEPAQAHLVRVVLERHVGPVVQNSPLNPPNLRGRNGADVVLLPSLHDPVPEFDAPTAVRQIDFVANFRRPTGPRNHDRNSVDLLAHEVVVSEVEDRRADEIPEHVLRIRSLDL